MAKDQKDESGTVEVKPLGASINVVKNECSGRSGDKDITVKLEHQGSRISSEMFPDKKDASLDIVGTKMDCAPPESERVPGGGMEKVVLVKVEDEKLENKEKPEIMATSDKEEIQEKRETPVKVELVEEVELIENVKVRKEAESKEEIEVNVKIRSDVPLCEQVVKTERSEKKKDKKKKKEKKKSKKEKKKEKKARKEAKKRKREQEELEAAEKSKKKKVNKSEAREAAKAAVDEPPVLQPVPADEDFFYMSSKHRYDCPVNRDFTGFNDVEPKYQLDDTNVDEMSPWKTRRCIGPILDYVKEQKAKGLDLDVPYEGQEIIKAPDPPKRSTPELRRNNGGRFRKRGRGRGFEPSFNTRQTTLALRQKKSHQERKVDDEYSSLLSGYVQEKTSIDYF